MSLVVLPDGNVRAYSLVFETIAGLQGPQASSRWRPVARLFGFPEEKRATVIQQVIRCDMCGTQKHQTNHWFMVRENSGELRISGWDSSQLHSSEARHLCGETCAHKLISQFLMSLVDMGKEPAEAKCRTDAAPQARIIARADGGSHRSPDLVDREIEPPQRSYSCAGTRRW